jgi:hypothetical protein
MIEEERRTTLESDNDGTREVGGPGAGGEAQAIMAAGVYDDRSWSGLLRRRLSSASARPPAADLAGVGSRDRVVANPGKGIDVARAAGQSRQRSSIPVQHLEPC